MRPDTFSATSLQTAAGCLSRYKAEVIDRGRSESGWAARVGSVCHLALEMFVKEVFIKRAVTWQRQLLDALFEVAYNQVVGDDTTLPEYQEARDIVLRWFHTPGRVEELCALTVLSVEQKSTFPLPVEVNGQKISVPVTYIMDRVDQLADGEYRVVDYKSQRVPWTAAQMREKIQPRLYALALQILYPKATRIWVQFDFLRHEPVEVAFTRDDNAETWRMIKRAAQRIFDTPDEEALKLETINSDCVYCVRKATCSALQSNVRVGGIHSLTSIDAAQIYSTLGAKIKALNALKDELDGYLLQTLIAEQTNDLYLEEEGRIAQIKLKRTMRRRADPQVVSAILGPELALEMTRYTVGELDNLIKSGRLTTDQIIQLRAAMTPKGGEPGVDVSYKEKK